MKRMWSGVLAAAFLGAAGPALAAERVEVAIRQVVLPDGVPRYTIPITVGGKQIEAMVDSGSTGLRILPGTLADGSYSATTKAETYSYGSGAEYRGVIATAPMSIGTLTTTAPAPFQLIKDVGCLAAKPNCPVSKVSAKDYGIGGDGIPKQGFKAIIGINMADAPAANPFYALGAKTWIIVLPKPGERAPGKLILNPTPEEMQAFRKFPIQQRFANAAGGLHDAIWGCLANSRTQLKLCGPFLFDSGGNGVTINPGRGFPDQPWGPGVQVALTVGGEQSQPMTAAFITGSDPTMRLNFNPGRGQPNSQIQAGPLPYFAFEALYDPESRSIGLKAR